MVKDYSQRANEFVESYSAKYRVGLPLTPIFFDGASATPQWLEQNAAVSARKSNLDSTIQNRIERTQKALAAFFRVTARIESLIESLEVMQRSAAETGVVAVPKREGESEIGGGGGSGGGGGGGDGDGVDGSPPLPETFKGLQRKIEKDLKSTRINQKFSVKSAGHHLEAGFEALRSAAAEVHFPELAPSHDVVEGRLKLEEHGDAPSLGRGLSGVRGADVGLERGVVGAGIGGGIGRAQSMPLEKQVKRKPKASHRSGASRETESQKDERASCGSRLQQQLAPARKKIESEAKTEYCQTK